MNKTKELKRLTEKVRNYNDCNQKFDVIVEEDGTIGIEITKVNKCYSIEEALLTVGYLLYRLEG